MADHQIIISGKTFKLIPLGFCKCGCGKKTAISHTTHAKRKYLKGRPKKYLAGHNKKLFTDGRHITNKGYVRIYLGKHHLSDVNGYAYEHRLIAENILGRKLTKGEVIHHRNGNKADNRPENIGIFKSSGDHSRYHLKK